ncbi:MarR family transcriptional regulator [Frankia sp. CcI49]|uniref:MarR family winged helix-turn-helix transcriptional regulator n=1 Tax=Frankia sp. CcI49 TaxID=1745382 RepID=UPI0009763954|nr:MarR family transcriptional regulator [Frankia sp. CcI49]ONH56201.1 MarR family transcriptional regulator [Frankia sp. CcI49]
MAKASRGEDAAASHREPSPHAPHTRRAPRAPREPGRRHVGTTIDGAPLGSLLLQTIRVHARLGDDLLKRAGVTTPHEIVVLFLDEHGPVPQTELVHYLGRDRSTVTATLQAMERADLVARTPSPDDRRTMIVSLTPRGRDLAPAARAAWHELECHTTSQLTAAEQEQLVALLTVVRDALDDIVDRR